MWINLTEDQFVLAVEALRNDVSNEALILEQQKLADHLEQTIQERAERAELDGKYVSAAHAVCDDDLEIDNDAVVSPGGDPGAWVMAWVWVTDEDAGLEHDEEEGEDEE